MSRWTHVAGVVRYDAIIADRKTAFKEMRYIEDLVMDGPAGSEGGLDYDVIPMIELERKTGSHFVSSGPHLCDVVIRGDLRDFNADEDWGKLEAWFEKLTSKENGLFVRQAILHLVEGGNERVLKKENMS